MKLSNVHFLAAILIVLFSQVLIAQGENPENLLHDLSAHIEDLMTIWQVPGLAVGVIRDGEIIFNEGFGYRDLEKKRPVTPKTVFGIGSVSKSFTSLSAAMLVDERKLSWDTPVIEYMPEFKLYDDYATQHTTLRDMLCHRTGMAEHMLMTYGSPFSREEVFRCLRYLEPNSGFREKYQYNNLMYMTAGYLVGRMSGGTWEDFVLKRILQPLGMAETNFSLEIKESDEFALPYMFVEGEVTALPFKNRDTSGPSGGINSSVEDMIRWLELFLTKGKADEKPLVSEKKP